MVEAKLAMEDGSAERKEETRRDFGSPSFTFSRPKGSMVVLEGEDGTMINMESLLKDVNITNVHMISPLSFKLTVQCDDYGLPKIELEAKAYPCFKPDMTMSEFPRVAKPEFISVVTAAMTKNIKDLLRNQANMSHLEMFIEFGGIKYKCIFTPDISDDEKAFFMMG